MKPSKTNQKKRKNTLTGVESYEGNPLFLDLKQKKENREQPIIIMDTFYTEKKAGVLDELNIRADRFDIGLEQAERIGKYRTEKKIHKMKLEKLAGEQPAE